MDHWHDDTTREAFVAEAEGEANFVQTAIWEVWPPFGRIVADSEKGRSGPHR